jgi:hypothetical protein
MRRLVAALVSAFLASAIACVSWTLLFAKFTDVPSGIARPTGWATLSVDAQNQWLFEHSVTISGIPALLHILGNIQSYAAPGFGFLALLFFCALLAQGIYAFIRGRAP